MSILRLPGLSRREFLPAMGFAFAAGLTACSAPVDDAGTPRRIARQVDQLMTTLSQTELARNPELATRLGLTEAAVGYPFNRYLTDRSQATYERTRVTRLEMLEALEQAPKPAPGSPQARHLDTLIAAYRTAETLFVPGHGQAGLGIAYPYVADQMRGAYIDVPDLMTRAHPVRTAEDARAYVARLSQFADAIDDERRRLDADAAAGVIAPDFILRQMAALAAQHGAGPPDTHILITTLDSLLTGPDDLEPGEGEKLAAQARGLVETEILPAYARFGARLTDLAKGAPSQPGVWQLPNGDAYYDASLAAYTHAGVNAEALHSLGQREVLALADQLDAALTEAGFVEGTVTERLVALSALPDQVYPPTEEGRAALLARLEDLQARADAALAREIPRVPRTQVAIRAVPDFLQASSPAAFYSAAPANGTAPGLFQINLTDTADWPDFTLATLVFHETIPGHHLESAVTAEQANLPLARQMIWNVAYGEGWGVYAETLADDMGLYADDPLGRIGYLQSLLFRAARLVADTGIHRMRWSRQQAIDYLTGVTGQPEVAMAAEVDRYTVWPGQAAAYWVGRQRILDLRERAIRVLGPKFDRAAFHEIILTGGPRPLDILEADVEQWYGAQVDRTD
ncbi:DUF885 domain-containing protein [Hyphomonas johnsonii]|uniref:DUF885 domain-containing protein n=1 Tax=Hyphomonas johnsonii MHS-2 TaxID=1280950 RepID=A0A059FPJ5_9PROT|nr:DUF885 domain-containing protein [Hyphomonas johnsonii]KCZ92451.1 hypothetical protein HJO_10459 [Hyphomonas johnsonii MHS-2]